MTINDFNSRDQIYLSTEATFLKLGREILECHQEGGIRSNWGDQPNNNLLKLLFNN